MEDEEPLSGGQLDDVMAGDSPLRISASQHIWNGPGNSDKVYDSTRKA